MFDARVDVSCSLEFRFLLDRCFAAHQADRSELADAFARAAEAILRSALPEIAADIARAASRKGRGDAIGARLVEHLDAVTAACTAIVLMLRGSRRPVVDALVLTFRDDPIFNATVRMLCRRALEPVPIMPPTASPQTSTTRFEVFAPPGR